MVRLLILSFFALGLLPSAVLADGALRVLRAKPKDIRIDGALREWGSPPQRLAIDGGASLEYWLAFDGAALYLAARIDDPSPVRTGRPGPKEDGLLLRLAVPDRRGRHRTTDISLYAGVVGSIASVAKVTPGAAAEVQVVEGPADGGALALEARIPLAAIAGGQNIHLARGALWLQDVGRRGGRPRRAKSASGTGRAAELPMLRLQGAATEALAALRVQHDVPPGEARHRFVGDVCGDARLEQVAVHGRLLVLLASDGKLTYRELSVMGAGDVRGATFRDLTGDGRAELMLTLRQRNAQGERLLARVFDFASGTPEPVWAVETRKETADGYVESQLRVRADKRGGPPWIVLGAGAAEGLGPDNYVERPAADLQPMLLPWGAVRRRSYAFGNGAFRVVAEEQNPDYVAQQRTAQGGTPQGTMRAAPRSSRRSRSGGPPPPAGNAALIAAFRQAQAVDPELDARFVRTVNVAEDRRPETLLVLDRHLLVVGDGYRGGRGYFYFELPAQTPADVLRVFTGDVTGDGRRELFVRVRRRTGEVQRELLLGYTFEGEAMRRILQAEVRRAAGTASVGNLVRLEPDGRHWALRILPGRARVWSADSYPFAPDPQGDHQPLLLPWQADAVRYRYDGQQLQPD